MKLEYAKWQKVWHAVRVSRFLNSRTLCGLAIQPGQERSMHPPPAKETCARCSDVLRSKLAK